MHTFIPVYINELTSMMAIFSSMPSMAVWGEGGGKSGVGGWEYPVGVKGIPSFGLFLSNSKDPGGWIPVKGEEMFEQKFTLYL